jgi:cyclomaltodextrinase / maltogenic alpha-amylase / neopullulanase
VRDAVFYEIFPDRFASSERVAKPGPLEPWDAPPTYHGFKGGDLLGIVEHLDYLADLGVNALCLTPVFASASNHRYHTYDYYSVDPLLGGDAALRELLGTAHARGMHVVLDGVFNHSGRGFWPFHHVVENGAGSPYLDWFYVDRAALKAGASLQPYPTREEEQAMAAASAERRDGEASLRHLGYRAWWDLPALPKLNTDNPHMREHLLGAAEHWLRFGIDGWRLDVAEEIDAGFWREFRARVRSVRDDAYIVAEIWRVKPEWLSGDTFDGLMNYPLAEALLGFTAAHHLDMEGLSTQHEFREFVRPMDGPAFHDRLDGLMTAYRPEAIEVQLNLLGSHDTARFLTLAGDDLASLELAMLAVMTLPGAPCIYYGDEIGMAGRLDPDNRRAFPWEQAAWNEPLLAQVRALIGARRGHEVLRRGAYRGLSAAGDTVAYGRFMEDELAIVVINAGDSVKRVSFVAPELAGMHLEPVDLPSGEVVAVGQPAIDGSAWLELSGRSGAILLGRSNRS